MPGLDYALAPPWADERRRAAQRRGSSMGELLTRNAREFAHLPAVEDDTEQLSWGALADVSLRFAGHLRARGIGPGDVVLWQLPNWWEAIAIAYGVWAAGAISFPVVPMYREHELRQLLASTRPRGVVTAATFRGASHTDIMAEACEGVGHRTDLQVVVRGAVAGWTSFTEATAGARPYALETVDPSAPALLGATSGTTSAVKVVVHSMAGFLASPLMLRRTVGYTWRDRAYMPAPLAHATGLIMAVGVPAVSGSSTVLRERWEPHRAVRDIHDLGITVSSGTAVFIHDLVAELSKPGAPRIDLARGYPCGGSTIPYSLAAEADALGLHPARGYGLTECPTVSFSPPFASAEERLSTDGRVTSESEVRVTDAGGDESSPGDIGELLVRGPQRAMGYIAAEDTATSFETLGWLRTGDLGTVTSDGVLLVSGRIKDLVNRGGEKISCSEIEELLAEHPGVTEVAVVAAPHPRLGEQPAAFVLTAGRSMPSGEELAGFLRSRGLAEQKIPTIWRFVDHFPRTASGKVRKFELQRDLGGA